MFGLSHITSSCRFCGRNNTGSNSRTRQQKPDMRLEVCGRLTTGQNARSQATEGDKLLITTGFQPDKR
ncbi:hypothetical protein L484_017546 [Morus notabilis]|uniref:Uncharacterized protein n=1 Tax=Morus notabilis TaxID=981085 RepID=W9QU09_9ROSA|nr:hypothetical protein L484_017546 [Morus notabilis]